MYTFTVMERGKQVHIYCHVDGGNIHTFTLTLRGELTFFSCHGGGGGDLHIFTVMWTGGNIDTFSARREHGVNAYIYQLSWMGSRGTYTHTVMCVCCGVGWRARNRYLQTFTVNVTLIRTTKLTLCLVII